MPIPTLIKDILMKLEHTLLQRRDNYAPPYENFRRIAERMTLRLEHKLLPGARINIIEAGLIADDIKDGRIGHDLLLLRDDEGHVCHVDNFHDKAGYAIIAEELLELIKAGYIDIYGNAMNGRERIRARVRRWREAIREWLKGWWNHGWA